MLFRNTLIYGNQILKQIIFNTIIWINSIIFVKFNDINHAFMKNYILFPIFVALAFATNAQNVGIGTSSPNALLDVYATNNGILIPRIALTGTGSASPLTSPTTSTLVYNTATVSNVTPGFYYWNGSAWVRVIDNGSLSGATTVSNTSSANTLSTTVNGVTGATVPMVNSISNTSGTNSLSTTVNGVTGTGAPIINSNALSLSGTTVTSTVNGIASNALDISSVDNNIYNSNGTLTGNRTVTMGGNTLGFTGGNVGIGTASPSTPLYISANSNGIMMTIDDASTINYNILKLNAATAGDYLSFSLNNTQKAFIYTNGTSMNLGTEAGSNDVNLYTNATMVMKLAQSGNVGIGTATPSQKLEVNGTTKTTNLQMTNGGATGYILQSDASGNGTWVSPSAIGTTNTLSLSTNTLTSTVNGVAATSSAVSGVSNTSSANTLSTTVNGVTGTGVNIINTNAMSQNGSNQLISTTNGVASTALTVAVAGDVTGALGASTVAKIQGQPVSATAPGAGQVLEYSSGTWTPTAPGSALFTAGTGLSWSGSTLNSVWTASGSAIYNNNAGNVGIGITAPSAVLHVAGGGAILGTTGSSSNARTLTVLNNGNAQLNFGSYPGAWTSAIQIQDNTNNRFLWISPLDNGSGNNTRIMAAGTGLDIYTNGSVSAGGTLGFSQNTSGNVGIGTTSPGQKLTVAGNVDVGLNYYNFGGDVTQNSSAGICWHSIGSPVGNYAIYRTPGAWTAPTYQQLEMDWPTGIVINGGTGYARSGTMIQPAGGNVGIGTSSPRTTVDINGNLDVGTYGGLTSTPTTYGSLALSLTKNGYYGLLMGQSTANPNFMWDGAGNGGLYYENWGWQYYSLASNHYLGIGTTGARTTVDINGGLDIGTYGGLTSTPTTYGSLALSLAKNGYYGLLMGQSTGNPNFMWDGSGNGGIYYENWGWLMYTLTSTHNLGIGTSNTTYPLTVNGDIFDINATQGSLGLTGDLPGYGAGVYPTLKSTGSYLYVSVGGAYSSYISAGGTYTIVSSRKKKENFQVLDKQDILSKINALEMCKWDYICEPHHAPHIAPLAEDFYAKFGLGDCDTMISYTDPAGIALVGVQALSQRIDRLEKLVTQMSGKESGDPEFTESATAFKGMDKYVIVDARISPRSVIRVTGLRGYEILEQKEGTFTIRFTTLPAEDTKFTYSAKY
jgi:hypothetical protein